VQAAVGSSAGCWDPAVNGVREPLVSVVICTYNRAESLERTLASLGQMQVASHVSWEVLVVDNNSTDRTRAVVERFASRGQPNCRYLFEPRQGKSYALNAALDAVAGEIVAFTDDDVTVDPGWVEAIWHSFEDGCVAVGGRIVPVWTTPKPVWLSEHGPYRLMAAVVQYDLGDVPCPIDRIDRPAYGANMAFRRGVFERYGRFNTSLGPKGRALMRGEDTEYWRRLLKAGERMMYAPDAVVYHPVERARMRKSYYQAYYYHAGKIEMMLEQAPAKGVRILGVPRYLFRSLAEHALRWCITFDRKTRFYHRLQCARVLGSIAASVGRESA
jgi:glycosyltransferase involved in cell wall biosynthesis